MVRFATFVVRFATFVVAIYGEPRHFWRTWEEISLVMQELLGVPDSYNEAVLGTGAFDVALAPEDLTPTLKAPNRPATFACHPLPGQNLATKN